MVKWKKPTTWLVLAFVVVYILIRATESRAETLFEVIPSTAFIAGHHYTGAGISITERFKSKYDVGLLLLTEMECSCKYKASPGNIGISAQRIVTWKRLELGIGASYWQNQTPAWNSNTTFSLSWGLTFNRWSFRHRHYSTGGSSTTNGGLDMLTVGYSFQ